jgi:hypothetical protein
VSHSSSYHPSSAWTQGCASSYSPSMCVCVCVSVLCACVCMCVYVCAGCSHMNLLHHVIHSLLKLRVVPQSNLNLCGFILFWSAAV